MRIRVIIACLITLFVSCGGSNKQIVYESAPEETIPKESPKEPEIAQTDKGYSHLGPDYAYMAEGGMLRGGGEGYHGRMGSRGSGASLGAGMALVPMAGEEPKPEDPFASQLSTGNLAYDIPDKMILWEKHRVELKVDDSLSKSLLSGMSDLAVTARVEVSTTMKAILSGSDFEIDTLNSTVQLRKRGKPTTWKWDVTPKSPGKKDLKLKLTCILKRERYSDDNYDLDVFEVERRVVIKPGSFLKGLIVRYWKAILGTIFGSGLIGWIIGFIRKKK